MNKQIYGLLASIALLSACTSTEEEAVASDEIEEVEEIEEEEIEEEEVEEATPGTKETEEELSDNEDDRGDEVVAAGTGQPDPLNAFNYPYLGDTTSDGLLPRAEGVSHLAGTYMLEDDRNEEGHYLKDYDVYDVKEDGTFTLFRFTTYNPANNPDAYMHPEAPYGSLGYYFTEDFIPRRREGEVIYQNVLVLSGYLADDGLGPQFYEVAGVNALPSMNTEGLYQFDDVGHEHRREWDVTVPHERGEKINGGLATVSKEGIFDETSGNYRPGNEWSPVDPSVVTDFFVYDEIPSAHQLHGFLMEDQAARDEMRDALGYNFDVYTQFYFSPTELSHLNILGRNWSSRFEKDEQPNRPTTIDFTDDDLTADTSFVLWGDYMQDVTREYDTNYYKLHEGLLLELDEHDVWKPQRPGFDRFDHARYWWN